MGKRNLDLTKISINMVMAKNATAYPASFDYLLNDKVLLNQGLGKKGRIILDHGRT